MRSIVMANIHPFLFAVYPVLFLYARNTAETSPLDAVKALAAALVLAAALLTALTIALRDSSKAGIAATAILMMLFSYGPAIDSVRGIAVANYVVGRRLFLWPIWCLAFVGLLVLVIRTRWTLREIVRSANLFGIALVAISAFQIQITWLRDQPARARTKLWKEYVRQSTPGAHAVGQAKSRSFPDIYYIILDEYMRPDYLSRHFNYDDRPFVEYLRSKGFYVAGASRSNYNWTYPSLASSLNFDYLHSLGKAAGIDVTLTGPYKDVIASLHPLIQWNRVVHFLKESGYDFVFFRSEWQVTHRLADADVTVARSRIGMSEFDRVLLHSTVLQPLLGQGWAGSYRRNVTYTLDELGKVPQSGWPTFTFAHITLPHGPFVFDAHGGRTKQTLVMKQALPADEVKRLYTGQVTYVNKRIRDVIDAILSSSTMPPVILLQADHGFRARQIGQETNKDMSYAILNAYYLPDGGDRQLYPSISPVNSFRVVFNHCLGAHFPLLRDVSH